MAISALPNPPSRANPTTFSDDADAFIAALPTFVTEANQTATAVSASETNAATSETNAANSAIAAENWATQLTTQVDGEYSAKEYAVGTSVTTGSSKDWATKTGSEVNGDYSAKEYAVGTTVPAGSAKTWSNTAESHSLTAAGHANYVGEWSTLVGALNIPASTYHNNIFYVLLSNVADVTLEEPGVSDKWVPTIEHKLRQIVRFEKRYFGGL